MQTAIVSKADAVIARPVPFVPQGMLWAEAIPVLPSEWEIASQKPLAMTPMTGFAYTP